MSVQSKRGIGAFIDWGQSKEGDELWQILEPEIYQVSPSPLV